MIYLGPRPVVSNLFHAVALLSLSVESRGPPSENNKKIYSHSSCRDKYEQTKYALYDNAYIFLFNFSISNAKQISR